MDWRTLRAALATLATFAAITTAYVQLGGPLGATRGWVVEQLTPMKIRELRDRLRLASVELFQWKRNNPEPQPDVQERIRRLEREVEEIEKQIEAIEK